MLLRSLWTLSTHTQALTARLPSNRLLALLRTRRGLKWGVPAMSVGLAYLYAAAICTTLIDRHGAPGWLYLPAAVFIWTALKFLLFGPLSLLLLATARYRQHRPVRAPGRPTSAGGHSTVQPNR
ncbi:MAG: sulfate permease [Cellulomonas sp.]|uniref:sulfate permease n=1 Tax=Cellulomonas sp. 73-92 TaxID=1895740 RepID=UPI000926E3F3|nr:sulfate permease [Cellulomonas sp. 73-92]MBN9375678.1 sulfate permease [Cellulomonas sp.]OJV78709.1 MAG: hypothetical protein BGO37_12795 [Cellulomonas sp. 73-92]